MSQLGVLLVCSLESAGKPNGLPLQKVCDFFVQKVLFESLFIVYAWCVEVEVVVSQW